MPQKRKTVPLLGATYSGVETGIRTQDTAVPFKASGTVSFQRVTVLDATTDFYLATYPAVSGETSSVVWNPVGEYFVLSHGGTLRTEFIYPIKTKCQGSQIIATELLGVVFGTAPIKNDLIVNSVNQPNSTTATITYTLAT